MDARWTFVAYGVDLFGIKKMRPFHPYRPSAGNNVSATLISQLIAEIRASRVIAGPGVTVRRTPNGTHVSAERSYQKAGSGLFHPWELFVTEENGERKVKWKNKVIQLGMRFVNYDDEEDKFKDETNGENGNVYLRIRLGGGKDESAETEDSEIEGPTPEASCISAGQFSHGEYDPDSDSVFFYLGRIQDGKKTTHLPAVPVIYRNLT